MKKHNYFIVLYLIVAIVFTLFSPLGSANVKAVMVPPNPESAGSLPAASGSNVLTGTVKAGNTVWYTFDVSSNPGNWWGVVQLTGHQESGFFRFTVYDTYMNAVAGNYTHAGSHVCEADFRPEGKATNVEYMPRLNWGWKYYVAVEGTGEYEIHVFSIDDDHEGFYDVATPLVVGSKIEGNLELSDDVDCFVLNLPNDGLNYEVSLYATKKMYCKIHDSDNNTVYNNGLNVIRDRGTSECVFKGNGDTLYFYLEGNGGTHYRFTSRLKGNVTNITKSSVVAVRGSKSIYITTVKRSKVTVLMNKKIIKGKKKRKVIASTSKTTTPVKLTRRLKRGDVITVIIEKGRLKQYRKKITIK